MSTPGATGQEVLLVAASGLARELVASAPHGIRFTGVVDDDPRTHGTVLAGVPVLGGLEQVARRGGARLAICAGKGASRRALAVRLSEFGVTEADYATLLAPGTVVPAGCRVGPGSILLAGVVLTADVTVGRHVVAMPHAVLTHDDVLDDFATVCAGVTLGGTVHIGEAAYLGMNASVREGVRVGADAVLGMGAALLEDLPAGQTWAGVPARPIASAGTSQRAPGSAGPAHAGGGR